jgi:hypothetical protein
MLTGDFLKELAHIIGDDPYAIEFGEEVDPAIIVEPTRNECAAQMMLGALTSAVRH